MPRAIIAPSVLASDFGQLTAECQRMMKNGAEWLHMGPSLSLFLEPVFTPPVTRCHGWVMLVDSLSCYFSIQFRSPLQTLRAEYHYGFVVSYRSFSQHSNPAFVYQGHPSSPASRRVFQISSWTAI